MSGDEKIDLLIDARQMLSDLVAGTVQVRDIAMLADDWLVSADTVLGPIDTGAES